jgi:hypothetical protein
MNFTHKGLCCLAASWLRRPASRQGPGCTVAISETANSVNGEIPDAIGWRPYAHEKCGSVVVEVKVSRSDFLADSAKNHRRNPDHGMGAYRYFMAPQGVIQACELPNKWGLIEVNERGHLKVLAGHVLLQWKELDNWRFEFNQRAEISTLAMCLNRVGDPQQFQDRMREMANVNARLTKAHDKLKADNERMRIELFNLRNPSEEGTAKPRMTHV